MELYNFPHRLRPDHVSGNVQGIRISWSEDAYNGLPAASVRYGISKDLLKPATEELAFTSARRLGTTWVEIRYVATHGFLLSELLGMLTFGPFRSCSFHDKTRITHFSTQVRERIRDGRHITVRMGEPRMTVHVYVSQIAWKQNRIEGIGEGVVLANTNGTIDTTRSTGVFTYDWFGAPDT